MTLTVALGEWESGQMQGQGIVFFPYGGYLKGFYYKNKVNGAALLKFPNGDFYEGLWRHGKLDGKCFKYFAEDDNKWALVRLYSKGVLLQVPQQRAWKTEILVENTNKLMYF